MGATADTPGPSDSTRRETRANRPLRPDLRQIGPYRVLEHLGEGGFGEVYAAEQTEPISRRVALKVIKAGMDTKAVLARFEAERQALAMMDHPNIAKVLDAGETEQGRPYFVMEYVRGEPFVAYCDRHTLSTRERLELFIPVCRAIQHAHQKGIIHRDIKPSNILVTVSDGKPLPKVIDFGVAKATGRALTERTIYTHQGQMIGTPEYMSPEQAEMSGLDVDTRTDVYSLGVVLYELLTGSLPFPAEEFRRAGLLEMQRIIREKDPPRPSTRISTMGRAAAAVARRRQTDVSGLARQLRGELDWVLLKSMEKDRTRRYDTASALALDIERFLQNEPVLARPPSTAYQLSKFVARHRLPVAFTAGLVVVLLASTLGLAILFQQQKAAREEAEAVMQFFGSTLASADPRREHPDLPLRVFLDQTASSVDETFPDKPRVRGYLHLVIGNAYKGLGQHEKAEEHLLEAVEANREGWGPDHLRTWDAEKILAGVWLETGRADDAKAIFARTLNWARREYGEDHRTTLAAKHNLALAAMNSEDYEEAYSVLQDLVPHAQRVLGPDHPLAIDSKGRLGSVLFRLGRNDEAEKVLQEVVVQCRTAFGEGSRMEFVAAQDLAAVWIKQKRFEEAEARLHAALDWGRAQGMQLEGHPGAHDAFYYLTCCRALQGDRDGALEYLRQMIETGFVYGLRGFVEDSATDPDLASLQGSAEFEALVRDAKRVVEQADAAAKLE